MYPEVSCEVLVDTPMRYAENTKAVGATEESHDVSYDE